MERFFVFFLGVCDEREDDFGGAIVSNHCGLEKNTSRATEAANVGLLRPPRA